MTPEAKLVEERLDAAVRADSQRTWLERGAAEPVVPSTLRPPVGATWRERNRALWRRHEIRRERAEAYVRAARDPERGLPVASREHVVAYLRDLLRRRRRLLVMVVLANAVAAAAGLVVPLLLGDLVDAVAASDGQPPQGTVTRLVTSVAVALGVATVGTFLARGLAAVLGHGVLAEAREQVVRSVLRLPLGRVEGSSTGDLVTRVTRDVGSMSESVRWALPEAVISLVTVALTVVAMLVNSWLLAAPTLALMALSGFVIRYYARRAPAGYLTEGATYSQINTTLTETVESSRTVEALGLGEARRQAAVDDIEVSAQAERYGLVLRNILFAAMDMAFSLPRVVTLAVGAVGYTQGWVSLGQVTTAMLYVETIYGPFETLVHTVDRLQVGVTSTTRLLGIAEVPPDRVAGEAQPVGRSLSGHDLRFAYRDDHDVLHGIDLSLRTGERLAIVGPSGSGKSTLGRLLSGINAPRTGSAQVGGVELTRLPLDVLRREVALVTQEHHVFRGTVRDNIVLAREGSADAEVEAALRTVDAWDWVSALPGGLEARLGADHHELTPAQSQQVALARLILADPHTLVLDEATSLIDPRTARHLEGSMSALLTGRTVVAIAHRLHTAHDADRIAVLIDGRIAELGSHDELMALDGDYAALWRAWTS